MSRVTRERLLGFVVGLGFVGVLLTSWLVLSELFREPTCPVLFGVPACYPLVGAYAVATGGAWFAGQKIADVLFYTGAGAVVLIGMYFSASQLRGTAECPSFEGLPMCYVSLFAGASMLIVDQIRRRLPSA